MSKQLIKTLADAALAYPELDSFREALFKIIEIEEEPSRIALGMGDCFVEITPNKVDLVCGADRISVAELARMRSLAADLSSRLLLPFTAGTDEDYDVDIWVDGNPTMPNDIAGGWQPGNGALIDDEVVSISSSWSSDKITVELSTRLASDVIGAINPSGDVWFEPDSISPQPWVYKENNWYSAAFPADFPVSTFTTGILTMSKLIPLRVPRIYIENIYAQLRSNGTGDNSANYYEMRLRVYNRVGAVTNLLIYNNQGQGLGSSRFSNTQPLQVVENAAYLEFRIERFGTASTINLTTSASVDLRYGR